MIPSNVCDVGQVLALAPEELLAKKMTVAYEPRMRNRETTVRVPVLIFAVLERALFQKSIQQATLIYIIKKLEPCQR